MLVNNLGDIEVCRSTVAELWPTSGESAGGFLSVGEWDYRVVVAYEEGRRWWIRVVVVRSIDDERLRENAALEIARRGLEDEEWRNLAVDLRDGETVYTTTLTCDLTVEALDRFLLAARDFLTRNGRAIQAILDGEIHYRGKGDSDA